MSETAKFIIPNFANLPIHAFKGREVNVFSSMTVPDWKLKVEDVMLEVCEDVKCEVGGLCGRQLGGEGSLLALRPPQPQCPPSPQHRLLHAHLLLPLHRPHLPRHHRCRHHHHQTDGDRRLVSGGEERNDDKERTL